MGNRVPRASLWREMAIPGVIRLLRARVGTCSPVPSPTGDTAPQFPIFKASPCMSPRLGICRRDTGYAFPAALRLVPFPSGKLGQGEVPTRDLGEPGLESLT